MCYQVLMTHNVELQLRELATLNGTLKDEEYCFICGESGKDLCHASGGPYDFAHVGRVDMQFIIMPLMCNLACYLVCRSPTERVPEEGH